MERETENVKRKRDSSVERETENVKRKPNSSVESEMGNVKRIFFFDFEKLEVYKLALEFVDDIFKITERLPMVLQFSIGDNLRRAAISVPNNIAEGSGKFSLKEKKHFFRIALTSDRECIPMITLLRRRNLITSDEQKNLRDKCIRISQMLFNLIDSAKVPFNVSRSPFHEQRGVV